MKNTLFIFCHTEVIAKFREKIADIEDDIKLIQIQEKEESHLRSMENKMNKATNILEASNGEESNIDAKRVWFQTHHERKAEKGD